MEFGAKNKRDEKRQQGIPECGAFLVMLIFSEMQN